MAQTELLKSVLTEPARCLSCMWLLAGVNGMKSIDVIFSVYNTCALILSNKIYNVDTNLDASDKVI